MTLRSDLANKSDAPDTRLFKGGPSSYERDITNNVEEQSSDENGEADPAAEALGSKKALWAYMILCFSTGPTSSMAFNYVSAAILSAANLLGHQIGSSRPCSRRGRVKCLVKFGTGEIDYQSYNLYLRAIGRALEGVVTIFTAGTADYSVLYCLLTTVQGVYTVIEASYIPVFMRSAGWFRSPRRIRLEVDGSAPDENEPEKRTWKKGFTVSVLGLVSSNVGGLVALIIGIILVYGRGSYVKTGYSNYLLAITIAGCITIVFAIIGHRLLPSIPGRTKPTVGANALLLPVKGWYQTIKSVPRYPQAFKLCIGWILWNTAYSNYLNLTQSLFLEVTGLNNDSGIYQVWSFTNVIFACLGSLGFLFLYPHLSRAPIKSFAYTFLIINILCVLWGTIGISESVTIGYKHEAEFWVQQALFMSTSSALRSYNRAFYASLVPKGSEAQFFGLEVTLDLATGWINPLVQGVIQNRTHNLRWPMLPNLFLMVIAAGLYGWVDVERGIEDAKVPL